SVVPGTAFPIGRGWEAMQGTAARLGVHLQRLEVREPDDYEGAFAAASSERAEAMVVLPCYFHAPNLQRIVDLAAKYRLPAIYSGRLWVQPGGLMLCRANMPGVFRRTAAHMKQML